MKNIIEALPIPHSQYKQIEEQLNAASSYVSVESGQQEAIKWIDNNLSVLGHEHKSALMNILINNLPDDSINYAETGYDSNQSRRKVAKIVGEAILIGGMCHESKLLGFDLSLSTVKEIVDSKLVIDDNKTELLMNIAKQYGSNQDMLFPGVCATDSNVADMKTMLVHTLQGIPDISTRNLIGVGGLRCDNEWNMAMDLPTYIKMKILEDKRYYPGMGIFYYLLNYKPQQIPLFTKLSNQEMGILEIFHNNVVTTQSATSENLAMLCATYIPPWEELKKWLPYSADNIDFDFAFHSPSYEFAFLEKFSKALTNGNTDYFDKIFNKQLLDLNSKLSHLWSFNSPIHLSWTTELASLSNNLMGKITNHQGDWCTRYGIGSNNSSVEIRFYHTSDTRCFPPEYAGKTFAAVVYYPESHLFKGKSEWCGFDSTKSPWKEINKNGIIKSMLNYINTKHEI